MRRPGVPCMLALGVLFLLACAETTDTPAPEEIDGKGRPPQWAEPIDDLAGLPNLHKVSDTLYRGAQPEAAGFGSLKELGIKTVVNLRSLHSDRSFCAKHGLRYVKISAQAWEAEEEEVVDFLKTLADETGLPVFVHCQHGADRTGLMVAVYRIAVEGWSKEEAIAEMTEGGFGYHSIWQGLIEYIRDLDVDALMGQVEAD